MRVICILLCALLVSGSSVQYDDGTLKTSLAYEYEAYKPEDRDGKAILTVEATKSEGKGHPVVSITSVLDISASMDNTREIAYGEKTRLDFLKLANKYVIERLSLNSEAHQFGSVVFSTDVNELSPLTTMTEEAAKAAAAKIDGIKAYGRTNLYDGLMKGIEQQSTVSNGDRIRVVLLFTDGLPTAGTYLSRRRIIGSLEKTLEENEGDIIIHVFAVGEAVNYRLLKEIADIGGGVFDHVVKDRDIPKAFASVLGGVLTEASLNLKYTIGQIGTLKVKDIQMPGAKIEVEEDGDTTVFIKDLLADEARHMIINYVLDEPEEGHEDGLSVNGTYTHAITHEPVSVILKDLILIRKEGADKSQPKADVDLWNFRYDVCKRLNDAAVDIGRGDTSTGTQKIAALNDWIDASPYSNDSYTQLMKDDLEQLMKYFDLRKHTRRSDEGMVEGLISVIGGGRPQSVDDMFHTVANGPTEIPQVYKREADHYLLGESLHTKFELPIKKAVSSIQRGKSIEHKVQLSLTPQIVTSSIPLSLTIVIDKDASNEGTNETYHKMIDALERLVIDLHHQPEASLGIILSSGTVETVLNLTKAEDIDTVDLVSKIDAFEAKGETALEEAVSKAIEQQGSLQLDSGTQAVFIITDGDPIDTDAVLKKMKIGLNQNDHLIHVHTFALRGSNIALLENIADLGQGDFHELLNDDGLASTVDADLQGLLKIGAKDVEIKAHPAENGITIVDSLPEEAVTKEELKVKIPKMYQGQTHEVLITVNAPETAMKLLDVEVKYTDILKPKLINTDEFGISPKEVGSTKNRELDQMLVDTLKEATEGGLRPSTLQSVVDTVYDSINAVSKAKGGDESYKDDLQSDLEDIASAVENALDGDEEDVRYADWLIDVFVGTIETQRAKGNGNKVLRVQDVYANKAAKKPAVPYAALKKETEVTAPANTTGTTETPSKEAGSEAGEEPSAEGAPEAGTKTPKKPTKEKLPDPFEISYENYLDEVTTDEQEVTITMELEALNVSDLKLRPSFLIFMIDASKSTTPEEIAEAKDAALIKWKSTKDLAIADQSYVAVIAYGEKVDSILEATSISNLDASKINATFDGIVVGGVGNFKNGFDAAFDALTKFNSEHPSFDLEVLVCVGDSIKNADNKADAADFNQKADQLSRPVTFLSVVTKEDVDASYFDAFPPWVRHGVIESVDVPMYVTHQPVVTRLRIEANPASGVAVLDIDDGISTDLGYVLPDLRGSEIQLIDIKLGLPKSESPQILHMPRLVMIDMRSGSKRAMRGQPLMIKRVHKKDVLDLIDLQKKTNNSLHDIADDVDKEHWPEALKKTSEAITDIDESGTDDDDMKVVGEKLKDVGGKIYDASSGQGSKDNVTNAIGDLIDNLVVRDPPYEPIPIKPKNQTEPVTPEVMPKRAVEPESKNVKTEAPILIFEEDVYAKTTDDKATIGLKIKTLQNSGEAIPARAIILMDASAKAEAKYQNLLIKEIVSSLANRDGKRRVEIWKCSNAVESVYEIDDISHKYVKEATKAVDDVAFDGELDITKVFEFLKSVKTDDFAINVVYWSIASAVTKVDPSSLTSCLKNLEHATKITVMPFKTDKTSPFPDFLQMISSATGGYLYAFFAPGVDVDEEVAISRIKYAAWTSVGWIEKTQVKEVVVNFVAKGGAVVDGISTTVHGVDVSMNSLKTSSIPYERELDVKISIDLKQVTKVEGTFDVIDATMMYVLIRNPEIREMVDKTGAIELLEPETYARLETLNAMMSNAGSEIFEYLGRNRVEQALKKTKDVAMQPKLANLELPRTKKVIDLYKNVGKNIEEYLDDRYEVGFIQKVPELIKDSKTEHHHYLDDEDYVKINQFPPSANKDKKVFRSTITVETPPEAESAVPVDEEGDGKVMTLSVVFDIAEYEFLIDDEVPMLEVQKMTVIRLIERFIDEGYVIDLNVAGCAYDEVKHLHAKRFDADNIDRLRDHLAHIKERGSPSSLLFGLKMGLPAIQEAIDSKRIVLLFTHASNVDLIETQEYQNLLMPYITYPINPVKVLTYLVGEYNNWKPDAISGLTGGRKINFEHVMDMSIVVEKSLESIHEYSARNVKIDVVPAEWYKGSIKISKNDKKLPWGVVGDMSSNSKRTIDLEFDLDEWEGDRDLFEYAVSYYLPEEDRWYQSPSRSFRLSRVNEGVFSEHNRLQEKLNPLLKTAIDQVQKTEFDEASKSVYIASVAVHDSPYQDDSLIHAYSDYLLKIYGDILKLIVTKSKDAKKVVAFMIDEGCLIGLNLRMSNAIEKEEPQYVYASYEEEPYSGGGGGYDDDDDWFGFTPWLGFVY